MIVSGHKYIPAFRAFVFAAAVLLVSFTPAQALQPGCDPDYKQIQDNHAAANTIKDTAFAKEIIKRPDSVMALSCFDQAMAASAKAGSIFSDQPPTSLPTWDSIISTGLGAAIGGPFGDGTTTTLVEQVNGVVDPVLDDLLSSFGDAVSAVMGSVLSISYSAIIAPLLSIPVLGPLLSMLLGMNMNCTVGNDLLMNYVIRQGIDNGVNYVTYEDLVNGVVSWGSKAGIQLSNPGNVTVLNDAKNDLLNLNTPGFFPFNPVTPIIPPNATVSSIVSSM
jgi:hypothetical protein